MVSKASFGYIWFLFVGLMLWSISLHDVVENLGKLKQSNHLSSLSLNRQG
jgi:hypothetical protein